VFYLKIVSRSVNLARKSSGDTVFFCRTLLAKSCWRDVCSRKQLLSPKSNGITWLRRLSISPVGDGYVELDDDQDDRFHVGFDSSLNIDSVAFEDQGLYSCFQHGVEQTTYVLAIERQEHKTRVGDACRGEIF